MYQMFFKKITILSILLVLIGNTVQYPQNVWEFPRETTTKNTIKTVFKTFSTKLTTTTTVTTPTTPTTTTTSPTNTKSYLQTQWYSDFAMKDKTWNIVKNSYGYKNRNYLSFENDTVLSVFYPNGSYIPSSIENIGGTGFYASPFNLQYANQVTFEYDVYFEDDFDFVKGGKLPGLFGGEYGCSGGRDNDECFSTRYMFRENGFGELYLYLNNSNLVYNYCDMPNIICNPNFGDSIGRGSFKFEKNKWTKLSQTIKLNSINNSDGEIIINVNDLQVIYLNNTVFRIYNNTNFMGVFFDTFFGGGDPSFATPKDQYIYYKNFNLKIDN